ncbi:MAG TPA: hypothetical protein VF729_05350 [Solirubrobacterales bacterium]
MNKVKALGLGLFAAMAISVPAAMNATASTGGHFYFSSGGIQFDHPTLKVTESNEIDPETGKKHQIHLVQHGLSGEIGCTEAKYDTTLSSGTFSQITIKPTYGGCSTTGSSAVTVTMNTCAYLFKVAANTSDASEQTAELECSGPVVEIHHPSCTITIPKQAISTGITYTKKLSANNKHYITIDVSAEVKTEYHGGVCIFTGTNHTATLVGSATVEAFNTTSGAQIDLTAT